MKPQSCKNRRRDIFSKVCFEICTSPVCRGVVGSDPNPQPPILPTNPAPRARPLRPLLRVRSTRSQLVISFKLCSLCANYLCRAKEKILKVSQIRIGPRFGRLPVEKTLNAWHRFCLDDFWNP